MSIPKTISSSPTDPLGHTACGGLDNIKKPTLIHQDTQRSICIVHSSFGTIQPQGAALASESILLYAEVYRPAGEESLVVAETILFVEEGVEILLVL